MIRELRSLGYRVERGPAPASAGLIERLWTLSKAAPSRIDPVAAVPRPPPLRSRRLQHFSKNPVDSR
jgi:hypothetical protein